MPAFFAVCRASVSQVISHLAWPVRSITWLQASMHRPQLMHSSWMPSRMSMPVGQAVHAGAAIDAVAGAGAPAPRLPRAARFAAPALIGDGEALVVQHRRLEARPGAHVGADLLARPAGQHVGGQGEQPGEDVNLAAACPVQKSTVTVGASTKYMIQAPPVQKAMAEPDRCA